jgi:hypothetical protein
VFDRDDHGNFKWGIGDNPVRAAEAFVESPRYKISVCTRTHQRNYQLNTLMAALYLSRGNSDSVPTLVIHNLKPTFV